MLFGAIKKRDDNPETFLGRCRNTEKHHRGVFWNHELRYGANGKKIAKSGPLRGPQALS